MFKPIAAAFLLAATPVVAAPIDPAPIDTVRAALKATTTMTANFAQTASNGTVATGKLTLSRPGKIRFQYDKAPLLIVADGKRLTFVDYEVAQVSQWPIRSTPLGVLLDGDADLARFAKIVGAEGEGLLVAARDPKHPEYGAITLNFVRDAAAPGGLALLGWIAVDAQNNRTEIRLSQTRYNVAVAPASFTFRDPRTPRTPGRTG